MFFFQIKVKSKQTFKKWTETLLCIYENLQFLFYTIRLKGVSVTINKYVFPKRNLDFRYLHYTFTASWDIPNFFDPFLRNFYVGVNAHFDSYSKVSKKIKRNTFCVTKIIRKSLL